MTTVDFDAKRRRRLAVSHWDRPLGERTGIGLEAVRLRLSRALAIAEDVLMYEEEDPHTHPRFVMTRLFDEDAVGFDRIGKVAELWELLEDIEKDLSYVECWCVIKTPWRDGRAETPSAWSGHLSEEQAEKFMRGIAAHYARKARHTQDDHPTRPGVWGGWSDRWSVGWATIGIRQVIGPDCTVAEYLKGLG